jgi:hypothetical protein
VSGRGKSARDISDADRIVEIRLDTMREGSLVRQRFSRVKPGMTIGEAVRSGVSRFDLGCAIARERLVLENMRRTDLDLSRYSPRGSGGRAAVSAPSEEMLGEVEAHESPAHCAKAEFGQAPAAPQEEASHFRFERQLRDFLADNMHLVEIDGQRPRLFKDDNGRGGIEYQTGVGPIDILATDELGALYVFELKRAQSFDHAMGQVLRYMGCIKQTIGKGREVYGVIVARSISDKLKFARTVVPNVYLFEYGISLSLRQAHDLNVASTEKA